MSDDRRAALCVSPRGVIVGADDVTGFLFLEQAYMIERSVLYAVNDVLVGEENHLTWYSFATSGACDMILPPGGAGRHCDIKGA